MSGRRNNTDEKVRGTKVQVIGKKYRGGLREDTSVRREGGATRMGEAEREIMRGGGREPGEMRKKM